MASEPLFEPPSEEERARQQKLHDMLYKKITLRQAFVAWLVTTDPIKVIGYIVLLAILGALSRGVIPR
jgi:hypothetical protein